jgi:hypothetical protein
MKKKVFIILGCLFAFAVLLIIVMWMLGVHNHNNQVITISKIKDDKNSRIPISVKHDTEDICLSIINVAEYNGESQIELLDASDKAVFTKKSKDIQKDDKIWLGKISKGDYVLAINGGSDAKCSLTLEWEEYVKGISFIFN